MARVRFHMQTGLTPERLLPMPTDFSQCRPELWPTLAPEMYEVCQVHSASADVSPHVSFPRETSPIGNTLLS